MWIFSTSEMTFLFIWCHPALLFFSPYPPTTMYPISSPWIKSSHALQFFVLSVGSETCDYGSKTSFVRCFMLTLKASRYTAEYLNVHITSDPILSYPCCIGFIHYVCSWNRLTSMNWCIHPILFIWGHCQCHAVVGSKTHTVCSIVVFLNSTSKSFHSVF